jgi:hypothetical protein
MTMLRCLGPPEGDGSREGDQVTEDPPRTFSQRNGLAPVPPQLQLGDLSDELRNRLHYVLDTSFNESTGYGSMSAFLEDPWERILKDTHVKIFRKNISLYASDVSTQQGILRRICMDAVLGSLFDYVEFLIQHPMCPDGLADDDVTPVSHPAITRVLW